MARPDVEVSKSECGSEDEVQSSTAPLKPQRQLQEEVRAEVPVSKGEFQKLVESVNRLREMAIKSATDKVDEDSIVVKLRGSMPEHSVVTGKRSRS